MNLDYKKRIKMQSIWQTYIDASISSTVNVPESFTVEQVEDLYMMAWKIGLKGITVFRDNCKRIGVLTNNEDNENELFDKNNLLWGTVLKVDDNVIGRKRKLMSGCGTLHCIAFFDPIDGKLLETYLSKGSTGGCNNFMVGLSRMISYAARLGGDIYDIFDQLSSTGVCPSYSVRRAKYNDVSPGTCCPVAVGKALLEMYEELQNELNCDTFQNKEIKIKSNICPMCGEELRFEAGCFNCTCGWSKCE